MMLHRHFETVAPKKIKPEPKPKETPKPVETPVKGKGKK